MNDITTQTKGRDSQTEGGKNDLTLHHPQEILFVLKDKNSLKVKGWKKI